MSFALLKNSPEAQIEEMEDAFKAIRQKAQDYERHEKGTIAKLYTTLADLYAFGETSRIKFDETGRPLTQQFIEHHNGKWSKPVRGNPYIALLPQAFTNLSASLKSQYAQVLHHAHSMKVMAADFQQWLIVGEGIKGRLEEAADLANGTARQINARAKQSRLVHAGSVLTAGPRSQIVALPTATPHKGFATVLVEIDGNNNASILRLLDTDSSKIDPLILKLVPTQATERERSAERPMGRLHRAIELILNLIAPQNLNDCHVRIVNRMERGNACCHVDAISTSYSFMWAGMVLEGHVPLLPVDHIVALDVTAAHDFQDSFGRFDEWDIGKAVSSPDNYELTATAPTAKIIALSTLPQDQTFRIGSPILKGKQGITLSHNLLPDIRAFIDCWRADTKRANAKRKMLRGSPRRLAMQLDGERLQLVRDDAPNIATDFLTTKRKIDFAEPRWLAIADVERLCWTLGAYESDATGWFVDSDVGDAGLQFNTTFPNNSGQQDILTVLLPTVISNGMHYAQACQEI
ncbi:hypothetical protein FHR22_004270 [Sphingopyxis panaciterrae]|uniref:hypothetical protein n=1 Tax=Sphingopyxis panaciterrae TaxID=363841 RepID=UPI0014201A91|nr:hypothetical protein [Sphingopyxis panaciterrae]NIJ39520.1 hypothetical protein [Sphingopyxis panaciterrae]